MHIRMDIEVTQQQQQHKKNPLDVVTPSFLPFFFFSLFLFHLEVSKLIIFLRIMHTINETQLSQI